MLNKNKNKKQIDKLLADQKSGFYKFVHKNNTLKTGERDFIEGTIEELYDFFISNEDPDWDERMKKYKPQNNI